MQKSRPPLNSAPPANASGWTLGPAIELSSSIPQSPPSLSRIEPLPQSLGGASLSSAALLALLIHAGVLFFLWQKFEPLPENTTPLTASQESFAVAFTPDSSEGQLDEDSKTENPTLTDLQRFQSTAVERTTALEQTLTQALTHQEEKTVEHQQQLHSLTETNARLRGELATLTDEKTALSHQLTEEQQRNLTLAQQVQEAERAQAAELANVKGTYDRLVTALQGEISQKEIALHQAKERLTVSILDRVLFPSGQAALTPEGERVIAKVATILAKIGDRRIVIEGHTDNMPIRAPLSTRFPTNWELSTARATEVVKHLLAHATLQASQLSAVGRADTAPVATNASEEGRRLNRRIEIIVLPPEDLSAHVS